MVNPTGTFREMNLVVQLIQLQIKSKIGELELAKEENSAFFVTFILSEENFCSICVLPQCIVY